MDQARNCGISAAGRKRWSGILGAMLLLGAVSASAAEAEIVEARYGTQDQWADVSGALRGKLSDSAAGELKVDAKTFGDPAPHRIKWLELRIRLNGKENAITVDTGALLPLDPKRWENPEFRAPEVQRQIEEAYAKGEKKIVLKPATYRFPGTKSQRYHLEFRNMNDFEIDATGSTFLFGNRDECGVLFANCRNVVFKGATLLREIPTFSQGDVKAVGKDYVDVEIHQGYPTDMLAPGFRNTPVMNFFGKDRMIKKGFPGEVQVRGIKQLGDGLFRFSVGGLDLAKPSVGDMAAWRRRPVGTINGELNVKECSGMKILGVTIKNAILVCIKESFCDGGNYYNFTVTYADPPKGGTQKPLLSSAADGFYSENARKGPTLENCLLEGMHDDTVNIHGKIWKVKEVNGNVAVIDMWIIPPRKGDLFRFFDAKHIFVGEAKLVSFRSAGGSLVRMEFDRPVNTGGKSAVNADTAGTGFVIRNCVTKNHRGRGFLVRPDNGLIENCVIEDIQRCAILATPEFLTAQEGPYVRNLVIRNNIFRRCAACCWGTGGAVGISSLQTTTWEKPWSGPWHWTPFPGGYRDIVISGNRFEECDGPNLTISSADGVTVKDNVFISPMTHAVKFNATMPSGALVFVTESKNVKFEGNKVEKPGQFMKTPVVFSPGAPAAAGDTGFAVIRE